MLDMYFVKYGVCVKKNVFMVWFEYVILLEYKEWYRRFDLLRIVLIRKVDRC